MFISLSLPLLMGIITRLALRPRQQGQQQQLSLNVPWWGLLGGWFLSVFIALLAIPTSNFSFAISAIAMAGIAGVLIIETLRGLGSATANGLSRPRNWLYLIGIIVVLYGLLLDPSVLGGLFLLGIVWLAYRLILGMVKPPTKGGK